MEELFKCQMKMIIDFPVPISDEAKDLIKQMLRIKPETRISIPQILCHPWLKHIIGPDGLLIEEGTDDDDDHHDFSMSLSFQRQECNFNPLSVNVNDRSQSYQQGEITERCRNAMVASETSRPGGAMPSK